MSPFHALDIALIVPGLPFNGDTLGKAALGGSETAGLCMARELAKLGHHVALYRNPPPDAPPAGIYDDVFYMPLGTDLDLLGKTLESTEHDVVIVQREARIFNYTMLSKLNLLWCHDLALRRQRGYFLTAIWNVDRVLVLSDFMREQYQEVHGLPDEVFWVTRNGIDLRSFPRSLTARERGRYRLVYSARPERGLDILLKDIFPKLLDAEPRLTLDIYGYQDPAPGLEHFYGELHTLDYGGRVKWSGLPKADLYEQYASARVYVYPSNFEEISCITAMECMAAGLPFVGSAVGALPETLAPDAATLIPPSPDDPGSAISPYETCTLARSAAYQERFISEVLELVRGDGLWQRMSDAGLRQARQCSWSQLAQAWSDYIIDAIYAKSADARKVLAHYADLGDAAMVAYLKDAAAKVKETSCANTIG